MPENLANVFNFVDNIAEVISIRECVPAGVTTAGGDNVYTLEVTSLNMLLKTEVFWVNDIVLTWRHSRVVFVTKLRTLSR